VGASIKNINFNIHNESHLVRAAQEGVAFSFRYGMEIMQEIGIHPTVIRAGMANMFLSPIFRDTLAEISGATIELYDTDGSVGAANGAGMGSGTFGSFEEAFENLNRVMTIEPRGEDRQAFEEAYQAWKHLLIQCMNVDVNT
jgi:xylulokinase